MRLPFVAALLFPLTAQAADLALRRVMLSSGGVGYYEFEAGVDGQGGLGLDVRLDQVDDVLKSLVVFDEAGGVGGIELPGRDQTRAAFGDVPFGPEALGSPLAYLNSLQGVEVTVQGPRPMTGRLLHAEAVNEPPTAPGQPSPQRTRVTLLTADGLRQFVLEESESVQVADAGLRARIEHAIQAARRQSAQDTRRVAIRASGTGSGVRSVRVAYVAGAPLWKASYRLVLPAADADPSTAKARLQGWATLENDTGTDWSGVSVSVQYGNPVTFRQALYRMYYVARPEVPVEVLGRILPGVDSAARPMPPPAPMGMPSPAAAPAPPMMRQSPAPSPRPMAAPAEAAIAQEGAEETLFTIASPVSLRAGGTASLPILDAEVPADRVSLVQYGQAHPVAAIRVKNTGATSLPAGVLTIYNPGDAAPYAGDARLGGVAVGESRLLSYAQDLRTGVEWQRQPATTLASVTAAGGVLTVEERERQVTRATVTAPPNEPRRILVEAAKSGDTAVARDFALPVEETASAWRFALELKPGETKTLTYAIDRRDRRAITLIDQPEALVAVLGLQGLGAGPRDALRRIVDLHAQEVSLTAERDDVEARKEALDKDEERLRANLGALQAGDALRTRLLRQLDADETKHGQLDTALEAANASITRAHKALTDAVAALRI